MSRLVAPSFPLANSLISADVLFAARDATKSRWALRDRINHAMTENNQAEELEFLAEKSRSVDISLKSKQERAAELLYDGKDVFHRIAHRIRKSRRGRVCQDE